MPTSSDGSPAIVINTPNGPIYIDSVTGEIIGAQPGGGYQSPDARDRNTVVSGGTGGGALPSDPTHDPTRPEYYRGGDVPPWIKAGYPDFASWSASGHAAEAADLEYRRNQIALQEKQIAATTGATGASTTNALIAAQTAAANLAEQKRQFDLQYANAQTPAERAALLDVERGKTLLGLGSRPDTLIRYLYAIRGLQPPQALGGGTARLPGFNNIFATPGGTLGASTTRPAGSTTTTANAPTLSPHDRTISTAFPGVAALGNGQYGVPGAGVPKPVNVGLAGSATIPGAHPVGANAGTATQAATENTARSAAAQALSSPAVQSALQRDAGYQQQYNQAPKSVTYNPQGNVPVPVYGGGLAELYKNNPQDNPFPDAFHFAAGGVIPEPVVGRGMDSGEPYLFGEKGPETVVPGTAPDIMDVVKMFMDKGKSGHAAFGKQLAMMIGGNSEAKDMKMPNSYADGGTIGYNPEVFNPSSLPGIVSRGYNFTPNVPLFPNVGIATGGTSLVPSAQRWNSLLPSEQQNYSGFLQDEAGVVPEDVYSLAQKLAPKVRGLSTPRYS